MVKKYTKLIQILSKIILSHNFIKNLGLDCKIFEKSVTSLFNYKLKG